MPSELNRGRRPRTGIVSFIDMRCCHDMNPAEYDAGCDSPRGQWIGGIDLRLRQALLAMKAGEDRCRGWITHRIGCLTGAAPPVSTSIRHRWPLRATVIRERLTCALTRAAYSINATDFTWTQIPRPGRISRDSAARLVSFASNAVVPTLTRASARPGCSSSPTASTWPRSTF